MDKPDPESSDKAEEEQHAYTESADPDDKAKPITSKDHDPFEEKKEKLKPDLDKKKKKQKRKKKKKDMKGFESDEDIQSDSSDGSASSDQKTKGRHGTVFDHLKEDAGSDSSGGPSGGNRRHTGSPQMPREHDDQNNGDQQDSRDSKIQNTGTNPDRDHNSDGRNGGQADIKQGSGGFQNGDNPKVANVPDSPGERMITFINSQALDTAGNAELIHAARNTESPRNVKSKDMATLVSGASSSLPLTPNVRSKANEGTNNIIKIFPEAKKVISATDLLPRPAKVTPVADFDAANAEDVIFKNPTENVPQNPEPATHTKKVKELVQSIAPVGDEDLTDRTLQPEVVAWQETPYSASDLNEVTTGFGRLLQQDSQPHTPRFTPVGVPGPVQERPNVKAPSMTDPFTFTVTGKGLYLKSEYCKLEFPQGAVERKIDITMRPRYYPQYRLQEKGVFVTPLVIFESRSEMIFAKPVKMSIYTSYGPAGGIAFVPVQIVRFSRTNQNDIIEAKLEKGLWINFESDHFCKFVGQVVGDHLPNTERNYYSSGFVRRASASECNVRVVHWAIYDNMPYLKAEIKDYMAEEEIVLDPVSLRVRYPCSLHLKITGERAVAVNPSDHVLPTADLYGSLFDDKQQFRLGWRPGHVLSQLGLQYVVMEVNDDGEKRILKKKPFVLFEDMAGPYNRR